MKTLIITLLPLFSFQCISQEMEANQIVSEDNIGSTEAFNFLEKCLGIWEGMMYIYQHSNLRDSVQVRFTAAKTDTAGTYTWKKEYLSPTRPMVKDYKLVVDDLSKGRYILDEGDGVQLVEYNVNNKLYSLFKVNDIYLSSSTELVDDRLVFEVTSGRELGETAGIMNYSYTNVQRVVMRRIEKQ